MPHRFLMWYRNSLPSRNEVPATLVSALSTMTRLLLSMFHPPRAYANVLLVAREVALCTSSWSTSKWLIRRHWNGLPRNTTSKSRNGNYPTKRRKHKAYAKVSSWWMNLPGTTSKTSSTITLTGNQSGWHIFANAGFGTTLSRNSSWATVLPARMHWLKKRFGRATRKNFCSRRDYVTKKKTVAYATVFGDVWSSRGSTSAERSWDLADVSWIAAPKALHRSTSIHRNRKSIASEENYMVSIKPRALSWNTTTSIW